MKSEKKTKDTKKGMELHPNTVIINNAQREKSREAVRQVLAWLSKTFPKAFNIDGTIRPLKVGIIHDIIDYANKNGGLPCSMSKLRKALVVFTRRMEYLTCVKMRDTRIDLNGEETDVVSEEASQLAIQQIKKTIDKAVRARKPKAAPSPRPERFHQNRNSAPKRRPPHSSSQGNSGHYDYSNRDQGHHSPYHQDMDTQSAAPSTKVKVIRKRHIQSTPYESNPYASTTPAVEKNFNVIEQNYDYRNYNTTTEVSTVERLKAKLGLKTRRHDYEK